MAMAAMMPTTKRPPKITTIRITTIGTADDFFGAGAYRGASPGRPVGICEGVGGGGGGQVGGVLMGFDCLSDQPAPPATGRRPRADGPARVVVSSRRALRRHRDRPGRDGRGGGRRPGPPRPACPRRRAVPAATRARLVAG